MPFFFLLVGRCLHDTMRHLETHCIKSKSVQNAESSLADSLFHMFRTILGPLSTHCAFKRIEKGLPNGEELRHMKIRNMK